MARYESEKQGLDLRPMRASTATAMREPPREFLGGRLSTPLYRQVCLVPRDKTVIGDQDRMSLARERGKRPQSLVAARAVAARPL